MYVHLKVCTKCVPEVLNNHRTNPSSSKALRKGSSLISVLFPTEERWSVKRPVFDLLRFARFAQICEIVRARPVPRLRLESACKLVRVSHWPSKFSKVTEEKKQEVSPVARQQQQQPGRRRRQLIREEAEE